MPVDLWSWDSLRFLLPWVLVWAAPVVVLVIIAGAIWFSVRKTDAAHVGRGFDVKQTTGQPPVATRKENDHG